ncbi:MAG: tripartite tricarboxylate transporter substrate-binding protein [Gemmatimonas sp.]
MSRCVAVGLALAILAAAHAGSVAADPVADFYKDKQLKLVVGYGTGGGYDVYARQLARYFGKYLPGMPTVVVQNMPGAGSLRAANFIYSVAPKDGTAIGTFSRNMPLMGLVGKNDNVQYDPRRFTWLGSSSSYANDAYVMFVRPDTPFRSIADVRVPGGPSLVLGGTAEGATGNDVPVILRDALGLNLKMITGYPDGNAIFLAVDRKEVDGRTVGMSAVQSSHAEWLKPGAMHLLVQFGRATRLSSLPDVPTARELATTDAHRALIELAELPYSLARPYAAPPDLPKDRAQALQAAFLATHKDPQYLAEAAKLKIDVSPIDGAAVLAALDRIADAPPDVLAYIGKLLASAKE